jgi:hypothetical protein
MLYLGLVHIFPNDAKSLWPAYVISPYNTSPKPEPAFAILVMEWRVLAPCLVASVVLGSWIAAGFRSN